MTYTMRAPCRYCGGVNGELRARGGQNCVFCLDCDRLAYNAPKSETGEEPRRVDGLREGISAKQRVRILIRAGWRCELCGFAGLLHVSHLLSVKEGTELGLSAAIINSDHNLAALCEADNLGLGSDSVSTTLFVALLKRHLRSAEQAS
jgi:hypothetical protein